MHSKKLLFVTGLMALVLVGGAAAFSVSLGQEGVQEASIFSWWRKTPAVGAEKQETSTQILADIEWELGLAQKSGGMSAENYRSIESKLKKLEQKKIDTKKARALLAKIAVGGQSAKALSPQGTSSAQILADIERQLMTAGKSDSISPSSYLSIDSQLTSLENKKVDTKKARGLLAKLKTGVQSTTSPSVSSSSLAKQSGPVTWEYYLDTDTWKPSRTPPPCEALEFKSPIDLSKANAILYPGQVRGKSIADYKAHGGFILNESSEVRVPFDAYVMQGARFLQNGTLQYGFDIVSECGVMMRFGHLSKLPPKFQALAEKMRPAVEMDSRTTDLRPFAVRVSKGELLATKVGTPEQTGMDWGLMDIRQVNEAAKNPEYRAAHKFQGRYDNYALCWLDYLPADEQRVAKALSGGDGKMGKTSDYCGRAVPAASDSSNITAEPQYSSKAESGAEPPLKLKSIGILLGDFDAATGKAGDVVFTKEKLQFNVPFTEFGFVIPASQSASGANKSNPQPTFQLPMGTKVRSLVDGVVVEIPKLYSGDYSVMVAPSTNSNWRYETEHVINPLVKVGDKVTAGQVIAEVSPHNSSGNSGFGLVEIGILKGGNPPRHLCPFAYLDPSVKDDIQKKLLAFYQSWEAYRGDTTLYNEAAQAAVPGCLTLESIEG